MKRIKEFERLREDYFLIFTYLCLLTMVLVCIGHFIWGYTFSFSKSPCEYLVNTGKKCFGCGGTHALNYFIQLHFFDSLKSHVSIVLAAMLFINYCIVSLRNNCTSVLVNVRLFSIALMIGAVTLQMSLYNLLSLETEPHVLMIVLSAVVLLIDFCSVKLAEVNFTVITLLAILTLWLILVDVIIARYNTIEMLKLCAGIGITTFMLLLIEMRLGIQMVMKRHVRN